MDGLVTRYFASTPIPLRGMLLCTSFFWLLTTSQLFAQSNAEPVQISVALIKNTDTSGGNFALLSGLAPKGGVLLNLPYAAITNPIRVMVVNETPKQPMSVEIFDSAGSASTPGLIKQKSGLATATFRVEGEYSVEIKATGDEPINYTFLLWIMPMPTQAPDRIFTKRRD